MVDSPGKMLYNRKSRKKQRTVRLVQGGRRGIGSETEEDSFHEAEVRIYGRHHGGGFFGCFFMSVSGSQRHYGTDQADYG